MTRSTPIWPVVLICVFAASASADVAERSLTVTATAYNSLPEQTDDEPHLAAWGDSLAPGMKVIAVSRDLIPAGLDRRTPVKIEGFPGVYLVLDKMNKRWEKRIDIYMGHDLEAARAWGKRQVEISW
ncbi:MAG: 3D domain-containing protein [Deltaproteobacteria bacterium]|nr:3D domain-containing protein [Deltaproteobacteria bacterium]MBW2576780.1 3D domain-containing protein [Deltaproteobacteria bacterium]